MPKYLYRFRPVQRLLGSDESEGELAGHYIYFASPEQLNDPLEGYRELYFAGDSVVWRNLFKRYIVCLIIRNYQFIISRSFEQNSFPDSYDLDALPPKIKEKGGVAVESFLSNKNIQRHILFLSNSERRVSKEELTVHLRSIHVYAMKLIANLFGDLGVKLNDTRISNMDEATSLRASAALLSVCKEASAEKIAGAEAVAYTVALYKTETDLFISSYTAYKEGGNVKWRSFVLNYITDFIESLKELSHRSWYTACFMETCSNSAIWGTYGDYHAGVCLKFKVDNSNEDPQLSFVMPVAYGTNGSLWKPANIPFEKVQYEGDSPDLDFFRSIGIYSKNALLKNWYTDDQGTKSACAMAIENEKEWMDGYWKKRQLSITTKMQDWQSESEYRLILQNDMPDYADGKKRCLKYRFDSLDGIIFGIRTPDIDKYKIIEIVERLCDKFGRESFKIYQAYHDASSKSIGYRSLLSISCDNKNTK